MSTLRSVVGASLFVGASFFISISCFLFNQHAESAGAPNWTTMKALSPCKGWRIAPVGTAWSHGVGSVEIGSIGSCLVPWSNESSWCSFDSGDQGARRKLVNMAQRMFSNRLFLRRSLNVRLVMAELYHGQTIVGGPFRVISQRFRNLPLDGRWRPLFCPHKFLHASGWGSWSSWPFTI